MRIVKLLLFTIAIVFSINLGLNNIWARREKTVPSTATPILSMMTHIENGTYPLGFTIEEATDEILAFLQRPDVVWEEKEKVLSRMPNFFKLLPPKLQKKVRIEFRKMDRIEYQRKIQQAYPRSANTVIPLFPLPSILAGKIPLSELFYYIPVFPDVERHPYSRWLP